MELSERPNCRRWTRFLFYLTKAKFAKVREQGKDGNEIYRKKYEGGARCC
jgi:hypothetical protein